MSRIQVAFINHSTVLPDDALGDVVQALQKQVDLHFRPTWGIAAALSHLAPGAASTEHQWWIGVFDDSDQAGALGYHDLTPAGLPLAKVFAKTDQEYGAKPSVTCSHELLEMLGDPNINLTALDPQTSRLYAYESADAVEADVLGYDIDGVTVSDFVLPAFFSPQARGKGLAMSYGENVSEPFALAEGGYLSYLDLGDLGAGWKQETFGREGGEMSGAPGARRAGFPEGSRRERRIRASFGRLRVSQISA